MIALISAAPVTILCPNYAQNIGYFEKGAASLFSLSPRTGTRYLYRTFGPREEKEKEKENHL